MGENCSNPWNSKTVDEMSNSPFNLLSQAVEWNTRPSISQNNPFLPLMVPQYASVNHGQENTETSTCMTKSSYWRQIDLYACVPETGWMGMDKLSLKKLLSPDVPIQAAGPRPMNPFVQVSNINISVQPRENSRLVIWNTDPWKPFEQEMNFGFHQGQGEGDFSWTVDTSHTNPSSSTWVVFTDDDD